MKMGAGGGIRISTRKRSKFSGQMKTLAVWLYNKLYNIMPFFMFKNILLRVAGVRIGKGSVIHSPTRFFSKGRLRIGSNTTINFRCYLDNRCGINIGSNVMIAHDSKIYTLGHDIDDPYFGDRGASVEICDYACIFSNVLIMPGVTIGKGAVVYPGSVVTKDVGEYEVVGGNPARFIRHRSRDLRYTLNYRTWCAN